MSEVFLNLFMPELRHQSPRSSLVTQNSVCHEDAFHFLLQAEAKRSQRSRQGYHILLVYRSEAQGLIAPMNSHVSRVVLNALARSLRETDYIGWYRQGHIIGSVLTVVEQDSIPDVFQRVQQSLKDVLLAKLGSEESRHFCFRLCRQHELDDFESEMIPGVTVQ